MPLGYIELFASDLTGEEFVKLALPSGSGGVISLVELYKYLNAASFMAWFNTLPTVLPTTARQPYNNGGTLAISQP